MAAKLWSERQKELGNKLELGWWRNCWKKFKGKTYYFQHPNSKAGYEAALHEWVILKAKLDGERNNAKVWHHHRNLFQQTQRYWDQFGLPQSETRLYREVDDFLEMIEDVLTQPQLPERIPIGFTKSENPFFREFIGLENSDFGTENYQFPPKWQERIDRLSEKVHVKEPQTIGYWVEKYLARVEERGGKYIEEDSADDRRYKLKHFQANRDMQAHITTIDDAYIEKYHDELDAYVSPQTKREISKDTKSDYFSVFRMFVRWASKVSNCELVMPPTLENREFSFREPKGTGRVRLAKKKLLWSPEEFNDVLNRLPSPYNCFLILMLNCGFRHSDISNLRWEDLHLNQGRIVIQRNKLNQQASAPVISYLLWPKTIELIEAAKSQHPEFVFVNKWGNQVEESIKLWWKRNKEQYGDKRVDFIRKTGATEIGRIDRSLDEFYLGEALSSTAKISYNFEDGEPCEALDTAIAQVGAKFGFCEAPAKTIVLTPELLAKLEAAGITV